MGLSPAVDFGRSTTFIMQAWTGRAALLEAPWITFPRSSLACHGSVLMWPGAPRSNEVAMLFLNRLRPASMSLAVYCLLSTALRSLICPSLANKSPSCSLPLCQSLAQGLAL